MKRTFLFLFICWASAVMGQQQLSSHQAAVTTSGLRPVSALLQYYERTAELYKEIYPFQLWFDAFYVAQTLDTPNPGKSKTVLLDRYFNSEQRKDSNGVTGYWHYTWEERTNPGFSILGGLFTKYDARLSSLDVAPAVDNLKNADVYIIVDPDHVKDNPKPNYVSPADVQSITAWVKNGGILLLMANDSANCELAYFNTLSREFGIRFTNKSVNMVKNDHFPTGEITILPGNPVFSNRKVFLKDICTLDIQAPARAVAKKENDVVIAWAPYGKGAVLAVGDPWLYNEYVDGQKLPAAYQNLDAADDLVQWLLKKSK